MIFDHGERLTGVGRYPAACSVTELVKTLKHSGPKVTRKAAGVEGKGTRVETVHLALGKPDFKGKLLLVLPTFFIKI